MQDSELFPIRDSHGASQYSFFRPSEFEALDVLVCMINAGRAEVVG